MPPARQTIFRTNKQLLTEPNRGCALKSKSTKGLNAQINTRNESERQNREILLKFILPPCGFRGHFNIIYREYYSDTADF